MAPICMIKHQSPFQRSLCKAKGNKSLLWNCQATVWIRFGEQKCSHISTSLWLHHYYFYSKMKNNSPPNKAKKYFQLLTSSSDFLSSLLSFFPHSYILRSPSLWPSGKGTGLWFNGVARLPPSEGIACSFPSILGLQVAGSELVLTDHPKRRPRVPLACSS